MNDEPMELIKMNGRVFYFVFLGRAGALPESFGE